MQQPLTSRGSSGGRKAEETPIKDEHTIITLAILLQFQLPSSPGSERLPKRPYHLIGATPPSPASAYPKLSRKYQIMGGGGWRSQEDPPRKKYSLASGFWRRFHSRGKGIVGVRGKGAAGSCLLSYLAGVSPGRKCPSYCRIGGYSERDFCFEN